MLAINYTERVIIIIIYLKQNEEEEGGGGEGGNKFCMLFYKKRINCLVFLSYQLKGGKKRKE